MISFKVDSLWWHLKTILIGCNPPSQPAAVLDTSQISFSVFLLGLLFFTPVIQLWCPPIVSLPLFGSYVTYQTGNPLPKFRCPFFFFRKERSSVIYLLTSKTPWLKEGDKKQKQQPEAPEPRSVACPTDLSQYIRTWEKARLKVYTFIKKRGDIQNPPGLLSGSPHLPFPCHLFNNLRRKKNCRRRGGPGGFHHNIL